MIIKIVVLIIGILLAAAGAAYMIKEKEDPESRKIYMITAIIGIVMAVISAVLLFV